MQKPNQWSLFFENEKDNIKKETGNEVVIIKDIDDILEGEENIFGFLLIPNPQLFIKFI